MSCDKNKDCGKDPCIQELCDEQLDSIASGADADMCNKCGQPLSKHTGTNPRRFRHTVVWGDTLQNIAPRYNTTIAQIQRWNNIEDANKIYVGQPLFVCWLN